MNISGHTRVFMVVGDPVTQVQAPAVFNRVFQRFGVDAVLVPAQVRADRLPAFADAVLAAGNIDGLWLTIPHKTTLVPLLASLDRCAQVAQSVNAVRRLADGTLAGALFDGLGLVGALRHFGLDPRGRRVLLLGAGGAGAAIAAALLDHGVARLALHDLGERAGALAHRLAEPVGSAQAGAAAAARVSVHSADPAGFDLVINATPLGLRDGDPLPFDITRLDPGAAVVDILMKPRPTPLLRACAERGITAHPGFEMLVQQVPDYLAFFGLHGIADRLRDDLGDVRQAMQMP
jgi:shikimate dehydrogenase